MASPAATSRGVLWTPPPDVRETTEIGRYLAWLERERGLAFPGYDELWRWSVDDLAGVLVVDLGVLRGEGARAVQHGARLRRDAGRHWFPGARLNFAEHLVGGDEDAEQVAVVSRSQTRDPIELSFADLREQVARARAGLVRLGVGPGDRVVAYLPNIPETLVAFAATASLGAVWASCAPELGAAQRRRPPRAARAGGAADGRRLRLPRPLDRPPRGGGDDPRRPPHPAPRRARPLRRPRGSGRALLGRAARRARAARVRRRSPSTTRCSCSSRRGRRAGRRRSSTGTAASCSSYLKAHALSWDLKPGGRLLWFTTTSWMMWNALVAALLVRSSIVMLDGDPTWPDVGWQWRVAEETRPTFMGVSPAFLMACRKAGLEPGREHDLGSIRVFGTAGSPLPAEGYRYVYDQLGPDVLLDQRQRRHRRLQRDRGRLAAPPGLRRRDLRAPARRRRRRVRPAGRAARRRAGRARDHEADAVDAGRAVGRHGRLPLPQLVLRHVPGGLAPGRLDQVLGARQLRRHGPLGRDPQPRRRPPRHGRVLQRRRGAAGDRRTASSSTSRTTRAARASSCCSSCSPTASRWTTSCAAASAAACARSSRRATCPTRSAPCPRSRAR